MTDYIRAVKAELVPRRTPITRALDSTSEVKYWPPADIINPANSLGIGLKTVAGQPLQNHFTNVFDVKVLGARGTGLEADADADTAGINAALAAANALPSETLKAIRFPRGAYYATTALTRVTTSNLLIFGEGSHAVRVRALGFNGDVFALDLTSGNVLNVCLRGMQVWGPPSGAYNGAVCVHIIGNPLLPNGASRCAFEDLNFYAARDGILFDPTGFYPEPGYPDQLSAYSFNVFSGITVNPETAREMDYVIRYAGPSSHHDLIEGCRLIARVAGFKAGDGTGSVGDITIEQSKFLGRHAAAAGVDLVGPANPAHYNDKVVVENCDFDGTLAATARFTRIGRRSYRNNNSLGGAGPVYVDCDADNYENRDNGTVEQIGTAKDQTYSARNLNLLGAQQVKLMSVHGLTLGQAAGLRRDVNDDYLVLSGGNSQGAGGALILAGGETPSTADMAFLDVLRFQVRSANSASIYVDITSAVAKFNVPVQHMNATIGTLGAATTAGMVKYISDGAGNKHRAEADGTIWRYPDGSAV